MLKLFLMFTSLFTTNYYEANNNDKFFEISIHDEKFYDVIDVTYTYKLIKEESFKIINNDVVVDTIKADFVNFKYDEKNQKLIVCYFFENKLIVNFYKDEKIESFKTIYEGGTCSNVFIEIAFDSIYLFYNDNNYDIICLDLINDIKKSLGGKLKDEIVSIKHDEEYFYFTIYKDSLSGGDFGNGGQVKAYVIARIDQDFNVSDYITLDKQDDFKGFEINENNLYIYLEDYIYMFSKDLVYLTKQITESCIFIKTGYNNLTIVFYKEFYIVYDSIGLTLIKTIYHNYEIKEIISFDDFLYLKEENNSFLIDFISLINVNLNPLNVITEAQLAKVNSLYNDCVFLKKTYLESYDANIFGVYNIEVEYKTRYLDFIMKIKEEIVLNVNVFEDMIYQAGYRLSFNSKALLDGSIIVNNYPVSILGNHTLLLEGVNKSVIINFKISRNQLNFIDDIIKTDIDVSINAPVRLVYSVSDITVDNIISINITGNTISSYMIENGYLIILLNSYSTSGTKDIFFESIEYKLYYSDDLFISKHYYLNKNYKINVLKDNCSIKFIELTSDYILSYECIDEERTLRVIEVELSNNSSNYYYSFPISDSKIIIPKTGNFSGIVRIVTYQGGEFFERIELFRFDVSNNDTAFEVGEFNINQLSTSVNKFSINLSKDLSKVILNNQSIDINIRDSNTLIIFAVFGILIAISSVVLGVLFKKKFRFKKKKA